MGNSWFDPVLLSLGPLQIRWYGLMYVISFLIGAQIANKFSREGFMPLTKKEIDKFVTVLIIGMFLGARLAYVFIYNWDYYSNHFSEILAVWQGGLSFHGGAVGMSLATYYFAKKKNVSFFSLTDPLAICAAQGLFFGRMGNFINGELYGRVTDSMFGIVFPNGGAYPRHPSQLYEGIAEGVILFTCLFFLRKKQPIYGYVSTAFVAGYGVLRFIVEFFRQPDAQLGFYFGGITMGQILCLLMILASGVLFYFVKKANVPCTSYSSQV